MTQPTYEFHPFKYEPTLSSVVCGGGIGALVGLFVEGPALDQRQKVDVQITHDQAALSGMKDEAKVLLDGNQLDAASRMALTSRIGAQQQQIVALTASRPYIAETRDAIVGPGAGIFGLFAIVTALRYRIHKNAHPKTPKLNLDELGQAF